MSNIWFFLNYSFHDSRTCTSMKISGQIWILVWMTNLNSKSRMASTGQLWRKQLENPFPASDPIRKTESQNVSWGCWPAENSWKGLRTHYGRKIQISSKIMQHFCLLIDLERPRSYSFRISVESFRTSRGILFHKQISNYDSRR